VAVCDGLKTSGKHQLDLELGGGPGRHKHVKQGPKKIKSRILVTNGPQSDRAR
jgi:hypothetical protein